MNLKTIRPEKNLSKACKADYKAPCLPRNLKIERASQVWQADITSIPMFRGIMYMFAIIDIYSTKIMGRELSNTMNAECCKGVLAETMQNYDKPKILNTDQGSQFISEIFVNLLKENEVKTSMDGKGRALDNIYIERFWGSFKKEKIYLNTPNEGVDLFYIQFKDYVAFYNTEKRHKSIGRITLDEKFK